MPRKLKDTADKVIYETRIRLPKKYRDAFLQHFQKRYNYFTDFAMIAIKEKTERELRNMKRIGKRKS